MRLHKGWEIYWSASIATRLQGNRNCTIKNAELRLPATDKLYVNFQTKQPAWDSGTTPTCFGGQQILQFLMGAQVDLDTTRNDKSEDSSHKEAMSISELNNQHEILWEHLSAVVAMQQILQSMMSARVNSQ